MKTNRLLAAALCAAFSVGASAQTIPSPADSRDSSARAKVAITPVDLSGYATTSQLNNVSSVANSAYSTANSAYTYGYYAYTNQGSAYNKPWPKWYPGQYSSTHCNMACAYGYIDGNGHVSVYVYGTANPAWNGWYNLGYTSGGMPLSVNRDYSNCGYSNCQSYGFAVTAKPTGFDSLGVPVGWGVVMSYYFNNS